MNVGFIGLGKLGLPCALAIESKGHKVFGVDKDVRVKSYLESKLYPHKEQGIETLLQATGLQLVSDYETLILNSDIIFVTVQTPHDPLYEGVTRVPQDPKDFDYSFLTAALDDVTFGMQNLPDQERADKQGMPLVVISTVLPGTYQTVLAEHVGSDFSYIYNPFFIAMGTVIQDFLSPEFILLGGEFGSEAMQKVIAFYATINNAPKSVMSVASAELTKVAYNTYITSKITFSNALMEICDYLPSANVDDVINTLKLADRRLISPAYMNAGMGDGGGCHPRDNIALSWLVNNYNLSYDIFLSLMIARERQTEFLSDLIVSEVLRTKFTTVVILGQAFKPETNLTTGSPARLLVNILQEFLPEGTQMYAVDPYVNEEEYEKVMEDNTFAKVFFIGTKHAVFNEIEYPEKSSIIDPWGYITPKKGCFLYSVGRHKQPEIAH